MATRKFCSILILSFVLGLGIRSAEANASSETAPEPPKGGDRIAQTLFVPREIKKAVVVVRRLKGSEILGQLHFIESLGENEKKETKDASVRVVGTLVGLKPNAEHAIHVHEFGDCTSEDGTSAGPHFDPNGARHGGPDHSEHHAGDFGNLKTNREGKVDFLGTFKNVALTGNRGIVGRSVVIHADRDDLKSQPAGNSGPRIACGVIGFEK